jgi:hypothetical protein
MHALNAGPQSFGELASGMVVVMTKALNDGSAETVLIDFLENY